MTTLVWLVYDFTMIFATLGRNVRRWRNRELEARYRMKLLLYGTVNSITYIQAIQYIYIYIYSQSDDTATHVVTVVKSTVEILHCSSLVPRWERGLGMRLT